MRRTSRVEIPPDKRLSCVPSADYQKALREPMRGIGELGYEPKGASRAAAQTSAQVPRYVFLDPPVNALLDQVL
jgi:hypothetical protein